MNQTLESDDELIALLEHTMCEVARVAPEMSLDEPGGGRRWLAGAAAAATVVAGVAGVALLAGDAPESVPTTPGATPGGPPASWSPPLSGTTHGPEQTAVATAVTSEPVPATDPPATPPDTLAPVTTLAPGGLDDPGEPPPPPLPIDPGSFPDEVPRPDTFNSMTIMTADDDPVGWEFHRPGREPPLAEDELTDDVSACTRYAAEFDEDWTSTPKTDEAPQVIYTRFFDNGEWRVLVSCSNLGSYMVQVMRTPDDPDRRPG